MEHLLGRSLDDDVRRVIGYERDYASRIERSQREEFRRAKTERLFNATLFIPML